MSLIIICLIIGLALSIERILTLSFQKVNTKKLILAVEDALQNGGLEAAKDVCRNTRGPVADIRVSSVTTRVLMLSRSPSFPTVQYR